MNDWEARYRQGDTGWDQGAASPALLHWLDSGALKPCRILIPGCGRGHEVVELAQRDFDVTAIDIAPAAVTYLQRQLDQVGLSATVICGNLFDYRGDETFDAIYEQTCLCAIEPAQREAYEACLYQWLKPGGTLFALFMQTGVGGGPPFHCDIGLMPDLFVPARWQWLQTEPFQVQRNNGKFELGCLLTKH